MDPTSSEIHLEGNLKLGIRRADRRVHRSVHGRVVFMKIGTHTKFDLGNNPLVLFLLF